MRLLYDNFIYYLQNSGGISTYWYELTSRMLKQDGVLMSFYEPNQETTNILRSTLPIPQQDVIKYTSFLPFIERFSKLPKYPSPNIFHSSYFRTPIKTNHTRVVTTIHDFTHEKYYHGPRLVIHQYLKSLAIRSSDSIIAVSQYTKNDLLERFPSIMEENVKVIYHGASTDFRPISAKKNDINHPFFLFVGSREHYKNLDFAVNLTAACKDFKLYIVGNPLSTKENQMLENKLGKRFCSWPNIDRAQLNVLYNSAFCLLYPSANEGFGIPILEAMQAGCPFIALRASAIPEVAGEAGILLETLSIEEGINAVATIDRSRITMVEKGFTQAEKFSWDNCFKETFSLYSSLDR